jgi:hypothetical protein
MRRKGRRVNGKSRAVTYPTTSSSTCLAQIFNSSSVWVCTWNLVWQQVIRGGDFRCSGRWRRRRRTYNILYIVYCTYTHTYIKTMCILVIVVQENGDGRPPRDRKLAKAPLHFRYITIIISLRLTVNMCTRGHAGVTAPWPRLLTRSESIVAAFNMYIVNRIFHSSLYNNIEYAEDVLPARTSHAKKKIMYNIII